MLSGKSVNQPEGEGTDVLASSVELRKMHDSILTG